MEAGTGRLQVAVRVRPLSLQERETGARPAVTARGSQIICEDQRLSSADAQSEEAAAAPESFVFDWCHQYSISDSQPVDDAAEEQAHEQLFRSVGAQLAEGGLAGVDGCVVAFGQAGAGKSYSLLGNLETRNEQRGLLPRVVAHLCDSGLPDLQVLLSILQISPSEGLNDLLATAATAETTSERAPSAGPVPLRVVEHPELGCFVSGLEEVVVQSAENLTELLRLACRERALVAASCGAAERAHVLYVLRLVRQTGRVEESAAAAAAAGLGGRLSTASSLIGARLVFAELADYEAQACAVGRRRPSTVSGAWSVLRQIVRALTGQSLEGEDPHSALAIPMPPGTDELGASKLTRLLRSSLQGSARGWLLAAVSASHAHLEATRRTLRFARAAGRLPPGRLTKGRSSAEVAAKLEEHLRQLQQQFEASSSSSVAGFAHCHAESLLCWEWVAKQHGSGLSAVSGEEAVAQLQLSQRRRGLLDESRRNDSISGPYLVNLSHDPLLRGCIVFLLPRSPGGPASVGSGKENNIALSGTGIPLRLCTLRVGSEDEVTLQLLPPTSRQRPCRCTVNGALVRRGSGVSLEHGDRVVLGWAHALQLHAPERAARLALPPAPELTEEEALQEMVPEESETYGVLNLYVDDIKEKLQEDAPEFLAVLREACHYVDEANDITKEVRPDLDLKFDIDFVWDILRRPEDVLLVRVLLMPRSSVLATGDVAAIGSQCKVLAYWTYPKFLERLAEFRSNCSSGERLSRWDGVGHPLKDPWLDPSMTELRLWSGLEQSAAAREAVQYAAAASLGNEAAAVVSPRGHRASLTQAYVHGPAVASGAGCGVAAAAASAASATATPMGTGSSTEMPLSCRGLVSPPRGGSKQSRPSGTIPSSSAGGGHSQGRWPTGRGSLSAGGSGSSKKGVGSEMESRRPPFTAASPRPANTGPDGGAGGPMLHSPRQHLSAASSAAEKFSGSSAAEAPASAAALVKELDKSRKERDLQGEEIRQLRAELAQVERERRLQAELVQSLRAQLEDKDELVSTLRELAGGRARPSRADPGKAMALRIEQENMDLDATRRELVTGSSMEEVAIAMASEVTAVPDSASVATLPPTQDGHEDSEASGPSSVLPFLASSAGTTVASSGAAQASFWPLSYSSRMVASASPGRQSPQEARMATVESVGHSCSSPQLQGHLQRTPEARSPKGGSCAVSTPPWPSASSMQSPGHRMQAAVQGPPPPQMPFSATSQAVSAQSQAAAAAAGYRFGTTAGMVPISPRRNASPLHHSPVQPQHAVPSYAMSRYQSPGPTPGAVWAAPQPVATPRHSSPPPLPGPYSQHGMGR
eukprot:TRINITY_DN19522_c1_g1_i1.p1 TRINITY_DN19522_c1_g1~~TRINITY_DN19522_c1_g1_i1.p1  ORF type:complete len:1334 (-),score=264.90 TRINITY_DN19522_c1_g1_i1:97-4077(-)